MLYVNTEYIFFDVVVCFLALQQNYEENKLIVFAYSLHLP